MSHLTYWLCHPVAVVRVPGSLLVWIEAQGSLGADGSALCLYFLCHETPASSFLLHVAKIRSHPYRAGQVAEAAVSP